MLLPSAPMLARLALAPWLGAAQVPEPPDLALEWSAPPECPDRAAVLTAISDRLGRPLSADEAVLDGRVVRDGARGFALRLRLSAGARAETRDVADPSCGALADAVALLVAAAVEPPSAIATPQPAPQPPSEPPRVEEPTADPPVPAPAPSPDPIPIKIHTAPSPTFNKRPGGFLRLHGGGELGAVPTATGALGLAGGLLGRRWRLELHGLYVAPRWVVREHADVRVALIAGAVLGCGRLGRGAVEVPLCLGIEAGAMRGEARGLSSARAAFQGWLAGVLAASVVWHAGPRWGLWGGLQLALTPVHPRFELRGPARSETLWRPAAASGRLLVGVEIRLRDPW